MNDIEDREIWWRKTGGGTHRLKREGKSLKLIKPNQKFKARPSEIPESFQDIIIPLEKLPEEAPIKVTPPGYTLEHIGSGWYNVKDGAGKVVNEKALRQAAAKELIESLMG